MELGPTAQKVSEQLRKDIAAQTYSFDLPSMEALAKKYDTSRVNLRQALKQLESEGLVRIKQGKGTSMVRPLSDPEAVNKEIKLSEDVHHPFVMATRRYLDLLTNPLVSPAIKGRLIGIIDAQLELILEAHKPKDS